MDELRGDQAAWVFDGESVLIRYETKGWFRSHLLKFLGSLDVPMNMIDTVDFRPGEGRRNGWIMHLRLRDRMDPYAAVGAMLDDKAQPFRLTGPAGTELVAEYLADQIRFAAGQAEAPDPSAATRLVPPLPLYIRTCEGNARFAAEGLTLAWEGAYTGWRKKKQRRCEYAFTDITGIEWTPVSSNNGGWGSVRVLTRGEGEGGAVGAKPKDDLRLLRTGMDATSAENYHALLLAATVTAHLWIRDLQAGEGARPGSRELETAGPGGSGEFGEPGKSAPGTADDSERIFGQIERLGELHAKGLISDEEFHAKKTELLRRI